jgi:hypothetical protein
MKIKNRIKYIIKDLMFLRTYNSPFKPLKLRWYCGKISKGVPYFLPRKWVKFTYKDCLKNAKEHLEKHPQSSELIPFDKLIDSYKGYSKAIPLKIGFSSCSLGWKTKWSDTDFRHEYNPVYSFVFFGYQIAVTFYSPHDSHYFEPFLFYYFATDKTKTRYERIADCRKRFPQTWSTHYSNGVKETVDYYNLILRSKYV